MDAILSPAARKAIGAAVGECRRCEPFLDFLTECGVDCQEQRQRLNHLKLMGETALELTEPGQKYGTRAT